MFSPNWMDSFTGRRKDHGIIFCSSPPVVSLGGKLDRVSSCHGTKCAHVIPHVPFHLGGIVMPSWNTVDCDLLVKSDASSSFISWHLGYELIALMQMICAPRKVFFAFRLGKISSAC